MKGPQRTNPLLKGAFVAHSSHVQNHLSAHGHWHHWHHHWLLGVYGYLPASVPNQVVSVPSGNSLLVSNGLGGTQQVRLAGVGAPVVGQALFSESQQNLEGLANGQHVRLFNVGVDFTGANVAQVFLDSGLYLNERQIRDGMAWNAVDDGFDATLATAEEEAQMTGAGLWNADYSAAY